MSTAIKFENISKQYRLGLVSSRTLSHDLKRWWAMNIQGKEDPYLKIGDTNVRSIRGKSEYVWALRDINLEVEEGDVLGIIGKNGAGKSTLLKLLSKVTSPTTGTIKAKGRIASLLEVGTGFHPEMTGRENIYLNGAILGMTKAEINRKLDEIVDFSGVERYVDTPVKRYSSGMMVRLGFAVAAHLDPEILVVDEVLAVGDAEFQKKAIGKMQDVSKGGGRTVLFVSHNMQNVNALCNNGIVLGNGMIEFFGSIQQSIDYYIADLKSDFISYAEINNKKHRPFGFKYLTGDIEFSNVKINNEDPSKMSIDEPLSFTISLKRNNKLVNKFTLGLHIVDKFNEIIGTYISQIIEIPNEHKNTEFQINLTLKNHQLTKGKYNVCFNVGLKDINKKIIDYDNVSNVIAFEIQYNDYKTKTPILNWNNNWGNYCFKDAEIELI
jgi:lipopolysaccharide transport system ATP-binding protein